MRVQRCCARGLPRDPVSCTSNGSSNSSRGRQQQAGRHTSRRELPTWRTMAAAAAFLRRYRLYCLKSATACLPGSTVELPVVLAAPKPQGHAQFARAAAPCATARSQHHAMRQRRHAIAHSPPQYRCPPCSCSNPRPTPPPPLAPGPLPLGPLAQRCTQSRLQWGAVDHGRGPGRVHRRGAQGGGIVQ